MPITVSDPPVSLPLREGPGEGEGLIRPAVSPHSPPADHGRPPPALCAGTLIATPDGPVPIEHLVPGDIVTLATGAPGTIWWIGTRDILPRQGGGDALLPHRLPLSPRDLLVSPTLALDGARPTPRTAPIRYIHLELDRPGLLLAEGIAVESYVARGDRNLFGNVATYAGSARLLAESDPDLHLLADGTRIDALAATDSETSFAVPPGTSRLVIASRGHVPAAADPTQPDQRRLGICLTGLTIRAAGATHDVRIADASLVHGFHPPQAGSRWTNGAATLPAGVIPAAAFTLTLRLARTHLPYGKGQKPPRPPLVRSNPGAPRRLSATARALVIDASVPTPDRDAGSNVILWHMRLLQRLGLAVTFLPLNLTAFPGYTDALRAEGIATIAMPAHDSIEAFLREQGAGFDLVYLHRFKVAEACLPALRMHAPQAALLFNPADLHHIRLQREALLLHAADADAADVRTRELAVIAAVDLTLLCNTIEVAAIAEALPRARTHMLPWVIEPPPAAPPPHEARAEIMFLGGFAHPPNLDAMRWFAADILPLLREMRPASRLHVYGADTPLQLATLQLATPGLVIHGHAPDLAPVFDRHRIMVVPLRYGAGFKGKVAEALARGLPIVATSIAVEGTGLVPGEHLLTADTAFGIAAALARLDNDPDEWTRLSRAGQAFAREHLSPARGLAHMAASLAALGLAPRGLYGHI